MEFVKLVGPAGVFFIMFALGLNLTIKNFVKVCKHLRKFLNICKSFKSLLDLCKPLRKFLKEGLKKCLKVC